MSFCRFCFSIAVAETREEVETRDELETREVFEGNTTAPASSDLLAADPIAPPATPPRPPDVPAAPPTPRVLDL